VPLDPIRDLRAFLDSVSPGRVPNPGKLEGLLGQCWDEFDGGEAEGMSGSKLCGRMRNVRWDPPRLSFEIERHGGTVLGSSRAERHHWNLDLVSRTAVYSRVGHRQLRPMAARLDVGPLAAETAACILRRAQDGRLRWRPDGSVQVQIGVILPEMSAARQTLAGRRRRFWATLDDLLAQAEWFRLGPGVYRPPATW
jgi:hypothetical protein